MFRFLAENKGCQRKGAGLQTESSLFTLLRSSFPPVSDPQPEQVTGSETLGAVTRLNSSQSRLGSEVPAAPPI